MVSRRDGAQLVPSVSDSWGVIVEQTMNSANCGFVSGYDAAASTALCHWRFRNDLEGRIISKRLDAVPGREERAAVP